MGKGREDIMARYDDPMQWHIQIEATRPMFLVGGWRVRLVNGPVAKGSWYAYTLRGARRIGERELERERRALTRLAERRAMIADGDRP